MTEKAKKTESINFYYFLVGFINMFLFSYSEKTGCKEYILFDSLDTQVGKTNKVFLCNTMYFNCGINLEFVLCRN